MTNMLYRGPLLLFYPEHGNYHGMCPQMLPFYVTKLPCSRQW